VSRSRADAAARRDRRGLPGRAARGAGAHPAGHDGALTVIGDEPDPPYDLPPLSKQLLAAAASPGSLDLPVPDDLEATWLLGVPAAGLDRAGRKVHLADGRQVGYDALVLATGARARPWPDPSPGEQPWTLRTRDDASALAAVLRPGARLLVVGAGFLGGEITSAARARDLQVTLVEPQNLPLGSVLGPVVGRWPRTCTAARGWTCAWA